MVNRQWLLFASLILCAAVAKADLNWNSALSGEHRSEKNHARDVYRHPQETLSFFGIAPGDDRAGDLPWRRLVHRGFGALNEGQWFADCSAFQRERRQLCPSLSRWFPKEIRRKRRRLGSVEVATLQPPNAVAPAAPGSVDLALAFRNVHSWLRADQAEVMFTVIADTLKPGGVLGIVQHRGDAGLSLDQMKNTAYVSEDKVIELAELAGLELDARSEINANPKDTKDHPSGVWSLPPTLAEGDADPERFLAMGESDRMTLRFVKPAE